MTDVLSDEIERFVRAVGPTPDDLLREMDAYAERKEFPHVGPEVGGFLQLVAGLVDASRIFEFGSGFGYSAYWFASTLSDEGLVVLTEHDEDELDLARTYFERGGIDHLAAFERGDALEIVGRYDGPFDVVLIDHQKHRYVDAFEAVRPKVPLGGVVVADNAVTAGPIEFERLLAHVERRDPGTMNEHTRGIATYLDRVRDDPDFVTVIIPLGEGVATSYRIR